MIDYEEFYKRELRIQFVLALRARMIDPYRRQRTTLERHMLRSLLRTCKAELASDSTVPKLERDQALLVAAEYLRKRKPGNRTRHRASEQ